VTQDHIREIFGAFGAITHVDFPLYRQASKGECIVEYKHESSVQEAMQRMHKGVLDASMLTVVETSLRTLALPFVPPMHKAGRSAYRPRSLSPPRKR
jgi:RNA recognition motif-containing protein